MTPAPAPAPESPTARGDREGRRRDVLNAAARILEEEGWSGFSIRAIANRAGVSAGAVYQWFSGKDEIFGELFDREMRDGLDLVDAAVIDADLVTTVRLMMDWVVALHERLGRYEVEFIDPARGRTGREIPPAMLETYNELARRAEAILDRAAEAEGITLVPSSADRVIWFWAGCVGAAERLIVSAGDYTPELRERFLAYSAERLAKSLHA
jgi:AcrR family transcriptional regulator